MLSKVFSKNLVLDRFTLILMAYLEKNLKSLDKKIPKNTKILKKNLKNPKLHNSDLSLVIL